MHSFLQFLVIGLGAGATYALFAQGAVLIYRGSGLVNFAQGAVGTFAAYIAFVDLVNDRGWATLPALVVAVLAAGAVSLAFQATVLCALRRAAPIVRVIATIALLGLLQAVVAKRYGAANQPVNSYLPHNVYKWGGITVQEERIFIVAITLAVTFGLWAWTRYTRVGLAINASAQNERAAPVQAATHDAHTPSKRAPIARYALGLAGRRRLPPSTIALSPETASSSAGMARLLPRKLA